MQSAARVTCRSNHYNYVDEARYGLSWERLVRFFIAIVLYIFDRIVVIAEKSKLLRVEREREQSFDEKTKPLSLTIFTKYCKVIIIMDLL